MTKLGFKVFSFKQRSESGDTKRYLYASDVETVSSQREMLQRLREEHTAFELLVGSSLDDESIIGADLLNDIDVATRRGDCSRV